VAGEIILSLENDGEGDETERYSKSSTLMLRYVFNQPYRLVHLQIAMTMLDIQMLTSVTNLRHTQGWSQRMNPT
jgi:hypothetical protein